MRATLITLFATVLTLTLFALLRLTLLIAGTLAVARHGWTLLIAGRLIRTGRTGCRSSRLGTIVVLSAIITLGIVALLGISRVRRLTVLVVRDGIAIRVTTTATATTTTTTTTTFAWEGRIIWMTFARIGSWCAVGASGTVLRQIGDGGGIEHFRLHRSGSRRSGDQLTGCDFFWFTGDHWGRCHRSYGRFTRGRRCTCRSEVSGEHTLQRLDEIVFAEPATILDLMFAGELSEVFDAECGEIRLIRHGSNSPAQTLRDARRVSAG
jgi:hypothetical protein